MTSTEIQAELSRRGITGLAIAQLVGCHETLAHKVIRSRHPGRPGTQGHRCAEEIARILDRSFDDVWGELHS